MSPAKTGSLTLIWWHLASHSSSCTAVLASKSAGKSRSASCCLTVLHALFSRLRRHAHRTCAQRSIPSHTPAHLTAHSP
jgi:hypothetical protein